MKRIFDTLLFILTGTAIIVFASCGSGKKNKDKPPVSDSLTVNDNQENDNIYYVWVDNLRARKTPGMDGEILTELKHGARLIFMGERSSFKDKINLRGKDYEDNW